MLGGAPFIPSSRPVLAPGKPVPMVLQGYNLGSGTLQAKVEVVGADGSTQPGGTVELGSREGGGGGAVKVNATFHAPDLRPGEYELRVTLTDGAGKATTSSGPFAIGAVARAAAG